MLSENSDDDDDDGFEIIDTADDVTKSVDSSDGQSQASGGMTSATSGDTKSPAPRKPPPPKVVRTSGGAGVSKYVYQGQDFKASPEGAAVNGVAAAAEPSAPPRRKHVTHAADAKKDDTDKASPLVIDASPVATSVKMEASPQMVPPAAKTSKAPAKAESVTESASAKIEASPQMTPPSPVVKAMEKRSAMTTAPPERPHERPGERASLVGSRTPPSTTTTAPPRPPPAKPSRLSAHSMSVDSTGGGSQSATDKLPIIPARPGASLKLKQGDKSPKPERPPAAAAAKTSTLERSPALPERPPPVKPARLSQVLSPAAAVAAAKPARPAEPPHVAAEKSANSSTSADVKAAKDATPTHSDDVTKTSTSEKEGKGRSDTLC